MTKKTPTVSPMSVLARSRAIRAAANDILRAAKLVDAAADAADAFDTVAFKVHGA